MKKKYVIILPLIALIILVPIAYFLTQSKLEYKKSVTINVAEELPTIDKYTDNKDATIEFNDIKLEDNIVYYTGTYDGIIKYKNKKYKVKLEVIDEEPPKVEGVKDITIYENDDIDLFSDLVITDNSKDEIKKEIEGEYDTSKEGEYSLTYVISDKSGNTTKEDFKLIVKPRTNNSNSSKKVPMTTSKGYKVEQKEGVFYINGVLIANKTYDLPSIYNPGGLLDVFNTNYNQMQADALSQGVSLKIISGFRSYQTQATLYNRYVAKDGQAQADRYSARPGHSEHQSGLAADINSVEQTFEKTGEGVWLNNNCYKYGFIIRYPKGKENITGYIYEPWHIRYVGKDLAAELYNNGDWITLEEYFGITSSY